MFTAQLIGMAIENEPAFVRIAIIDITERKRVESALQQERALLEQRVAERTAELHESNRKLSQASRLKDDFLANMSHELRTPLNAILTHSEVLQGKTYGVLNEKQLKAIHNIEESGQHLLALINDLLDLSKIAAGKLDLQLGPVHLESLCAACQSLIAPLAEKKQLAFSVTWDPVTTLEADERRLKETLVNLLSNAVKFTPPGGAIGLEVKGEAKEKLVHFTVWDTGIGIAKPEIEQLFQPFVQLDSRLERDYSGTGLGLALVKGFVELHDGKITVESPAFSPQSLKKDAGTGSRFIVSLPWKRPQSGQSRDQG